MARRVACARARNVEHSRMEQGTGNRERKNRMRGPFGSALAVRTGHAGVAGRANVERRLRDGESAGGLDPGRVTARVARSRRESPARRRSGLFGGRAGAARGPWPRGESGGGGLSKGTGRFGGRGSRIAAGARVRAACDMAQQLRQVRRVLHAGAGSRVAACDMAPLRNLPSRVGGFPYVSAAARAYGRGLAGLSARFRWVAHGGIQQTGRGPAARGGGAGMQIARLA